MPLVLIADADSVQRAMIGGLLDRVTGVTVAYASNATDAIEAVRRSLPDMVLTDLQFSESGGIRFIDQVHRVQPGLPVVILASPGHEAAAVDALRRGATTYVSRSHLGRELVSTIHEVLRVAGAEQGHRRILDCFTSSVTEFSLDNDPALTEPLIGFLLESLARIGLCDESRRIRVGIALQEALSNAMIHGNLEVSSDLRDHGDERYSQLVHERRRLQPWCDRRVRVTARESRSEAMYVICDEGRGFDVNAVSDPLDPAHLERPSGRGLLLIRTFMDHVEFNAAGNQITMSVRRCSDGEPCAVGHGNFSRNG